MNEQGIFYLTFFLQNSLSIYESRIVRLMFQGKPNRFCFDRLFVHACIRITRATDALLHFSPSFFIRAHYITVSPSLGNRDSVSLFQIGVQCMSNKPIMLYVCGYTLLE